MLTKTRMDRGSNRGVRRVEPILVKGSNPNVRESTCHT